MKYHPLLVARSQSKAELLRILGRKKKRILQRQGLKEVSKKDINSKPKTTSPRGGSTAL